MFDGVEAKRVDPAVILGQLIAAIHRIPWRVDLVEATTVWPASPTPGPHGLVDEDNPGVTGPWVSELRPPTRDALAALRDADMPAVVARWVQAEELHGADVEAVQPLAEELILLARRARRVGEQLYCGTSLQGRRAGRANALPSRG